MEIELNVKPRRALDSSVIITVPNDVKDLEKYLRDYVFSNIILARFKVVK
jgi:hypothetical protein